MWEVLPMMDVSLANMASMESSGQSLTEVAPLTILPSLLLSLTHFPSTFYNTLEVVLVSLSVSSILSQSKTVKVPTDQQLRHISLLSLLSPALMDLLQPIPETC